MLHHDGATHLADLLCRVEGFDPVVMQAGGHEPVLPGQAAGEYLLLPDEQAKRWHRALTYCEGNMERAQEAEAARAEINVEILSSDSVDGELAAFDILLDGAYAGHWVVAADGASSVTWLPGGEQNEIPAPDPYDPADAEASIRAVIPIEHLDRS